MSQKKPKSAKIQYSKGQFLVYATEDGHIKIDVRLENETVWLTQADMAKLFQCSSDNISLHLKNIFDEGELQAKATAEDFSVVRLEGGRQIRRDLAFYNLDAIISVGYRVKSHVAVIVTNALPKDVAGFEFVDGIWVTNVASFAPLCSALRMQITQIFAARLANVGKNEKIEAIYQYIAGHEFRQRVHAIVEAFTNMKTDLEKEKIAAQKHWVKREKELSRVIEGTVGMHGDLEGIIGNALPRVEGLELAALSEGENKPIELKQQKLR